MKTLHKRTSQRVAARIRRHARVRKKIRGTPERPRLVVNRTLKHMYAQIVDDVAGRTIVAASSLEPGVQRGEGGKRAVSSQVGALLARRAVERGVRRVAFDRNGYLYHGRVQALADAARENGLEF